MLYDTRNSCVFLCGILTQYTLGCSERVSQKNNFVKSAPFTKPIFWCLWRWMMWPPHSVVTFGLPPVRKMYDQHSSVRWGFAEIARHLFFLSLISPSFRPAVATPVFQLIITEAHPPTTKTFAQNVSLVAPQPSPWPSNSHNQTVSSTLVPSLVIIVSKNVAQSETTAKKPPKNLPHIFTYQSHRMLANLLHSPFPKTLVWVPCRTSL